jgi:2-methylaconitate cis-trans-isomerase PrpF
MRMLTQISGSRTGKLLPTGSVTNKFDGIQTTCIDVGNPIVFVQADDLGIDGAILPHELIKHHTDVLQRLETIRYQTAIGIGIANEDMKTLPKSAPKICMVSRLKRYFLLSGEEVEQSSVDLVVRPISQESQSHRTCQITVALGAAAEMRDLVMKNMLSHGRVVNDSLTIGHPSGTMVVSAKFINQAGSTEIVLDHVTVFRTARRIMDGEPYWNLREEIQN